ncbi:MAG: sensor histidine kinase [Chitinophagales bacterium]|jgi:signal transduction histidine kinase|nr:sensor histidine kinase [Chitinophagales bacterium]
MTDYNSIANVALVSLTGYHAVSFAAQYLTTGRKEFLYYSIYLLCGSVYYFLFFSQPVFPPKASTAAANTQNTLRMTLALVQIFVYTLFTVVYLNVNPKMGWIYTFFKGYLVFVPSAYALYLLLYFMQAEQPFFLAVFYLITIPVLVAYFYAISLLVTIHSNIYMAGTLCNMIGTIVSFLMGVYWPLSSFNHHLPAQAGLLLDLFILSYGLSLKSAETDKKLIVALHQNQQLLETERGRFARDLHDGLGGLLSSVKFSFQKLKAELMLCPATEHQFDQTLKNLDNGINELRSIAQNMMPENLERFGLEASLRDLCSKFSSVSDLKIFYHAFGMENYCPNTEKDLAIYRIVQELVHNALKHAQASQLIMQLVHTPAVLVLTAEDNGCGFDSQRLKTSPGNGYKNMYSRVALIQGKLNLESNRHGTTITLEIPL